MIRSVAVIETVKKNLTVILIFILSSLFPLFLILNIERVFGSPLSPPDTPPDTPPDITQPLTPPDITIQPTVPPAPGPSGGNSQNPSPPGPPGSHCDMQPPTSAANIFQVKRYKGSVTLTFAPASGNVTYYFIAYGTKVGDESYGVAFDQGYSPGALNFTINMLDPRKTYYFKIRGGNGCMPGPWSPWVSTRGAKQGVLPLPKNPPSIVVNKPAEKNKKDVQSGQPNVVLPQIPKETVPPPQDIKSDNYQPTQVTQMEVVKLPNPRKTVWSKILEFIGF